MIIRQSMFRGYWYPYNSGLNPCPPMVVKKYVLPPPVFYKFQPMGAPQFTPEAALFHGALWPMLVDGFYREEGIS